MPMRHVVIIAPQEDAHALVVAKRVEQLGAKCVILDSAEYPAKWQLTVRISNHEPPRFVLQQNDLEVSDATLCGVWWRRPRRYVAPGEVLEPHFRRFIAAEAREAFEGWLLSLGSRLINSPCAESSARKIVQLQCAAESGLTIPESLITNCPQRAEAFYRFVGPGTVFKPFTATTWAMLATQRMTPDAVGHLAAVANAPVIFQQEIPKISDIRVNIVDGKMFATKIDSKRKDAPIDLRVEEGCEYADHDLPDRVRRGLLELMNRLGLRFGACDLGLMADGQHVFFEVNPGGQWLFAEIESGQPISTALAHALLRNPEEAVLN